MQRMTSVRASIRMPFLIDLGSDLCDPDHDGLELTVNVGLDPALVAKEGVLIGYQLGFALNLASPTQRGRWTNRAAHFLNAHFHRTSELVDPILLKGETDMCVR